MKRFKFTDSQVNDAILFGQIPLLRQNLFVRLFIEPIQSYGNQIRIPP